MDKQEADKVVIYERLKADQKIIDAQVTTNGLGNRLVGSYEAGNVEVMLFASNTYEEITANDGSLRVDIYSANEHHHCAPEFRPVSKLHEIFDQLRNGSLRRALKILYGYNCDGTIRDREKLKIMVDAAIYRDTHQLHNYSVTSTPLFRITFMMNLQLDSDLIDRLIETSDPTGDNNQAWIGELIASLNSVREKTLREIDQ